ncbi:TylF/MycF family methyltransferase [Alphaproteobacteria bacterium]|nr:TylF/MycF family methyltransferase [Alphaproteobacteria bacterium]
MDGKPRLNVEEQNYYKQMKQHLRKKDAEYILSLSNVLNSRQTITRNLARTKLFELQLEVPGFIVECGSYRGDGLGLFYQLSSVLEPTNFNRKILSFDTFTGFPSVSENDLKYEKVGDLFADVDFEFLKTAFQINDYNRMVGHTPKVEFVVGDATETIPKFVQENPFLLVSLLYLDFDLYEPTKIALEFLLPLVPKGGVVAFDELAMKKWEGETVAFKEVLSTNEIKLRRFSFEPYLSYFIVGD